MTESRLLRLPLALLLCLAAPSCGAKAPKDLKDPKGPAQNDLGAALDRDLKALAAYGYSGAVLVAQKGQIVLNQGYGLADRAHGQPFTADTLFDIASISKPFTAAAILRLEMAGKLKVEDTLGRFFPQAPPDKAAITLHQLLTHTSCLPEIVGEEYEPLTREAFLKRVFATKLLRLRENRRFFYSNVGYSLLAAVAEKVTGRPFGEVLRDEVFLPAGMRHSGYYPDASDRPRLAHGYTHTGDWGTPLDQPWAPDGPWWNLRGNGGVLTTTGDLFRWHQALAGDSVLSAPARQKYQQEYIQETNAPFPKYAYGWSVAKSPSGGKKLSHVGGNLVFQSSYRRFPDDGVVVVAVSSAADFSGIAIADLLEHRAFGKPSVGPPPVVPATAAELGRCAGDYLLAAGDRLHVAAEPGRLAVIPEGGEALALVSGTPDEERTKRFAKRTGEVGDALAEALHGTTGPLAQVFDWNPSEAGKRWRAALAPSVAELGAWQDAKVLGTRSIGGQVVTHALLTFAKGARVLDVIWSGPTAENLAISPAVRPSYFLPEAPSRFVTYDVGTGTMVRLSCGGTGGPAPALRFESATGPVEAKRSPG